MRKKKTKYKNVHLKFYSYFSKIIKKNLRNITNSVT